MPRGTHTTCTYLDFPLARRIRVLRGLTQKGVAKDIGVTPGTYENWEKGKARPALTAERLAQLERLEKVLGLKRGDLVVRRPQDFPWRRLNGDLIRTIRADFRAIRDECAPTPAEVVLAIGLIDEDIYLSWEAGELHDEGLAFQYRVLNDYADWSGASRDALLLPLVAAPLPPLLVPGTPDTEPFVGRQAALERLRQWLGAPASAPRVLVVQGGSGSGKTALLARVLEAQGEAARPCGLLYWNFSANPRSEEFLDAALAYFGADTGLHTTPSHERLADWLGKRDPRRHVLVLDGLEALQDAGGASTTPGLITDPSIRRLLVSIATGLGGTRALIASRLPFPDLPAASRCRPIALADLARAEALDLLQRLGIADAALAVRLLERCGTHPLSLRVAAAVALEGCGPLPEPTTRPRLEVILRHLGALEQDLLRVLAGLPSDASLATLLDLAGAPPRFAGTLAGTTPKALGAVLEHLHALGLVSRIDGTRYRLHAGIADLCREAPPDREDRRPDAAPAPDAAPTASAGQAARTWRWQLALLSLNRGRAHAKRLLDALRHPFAAAPDRADRARQPSPDTLTELREVLKVFDLVPAGPEAPVNLWHSPLRTGAAPVPGLDEAGLRRLVGLFESAVETGHPDLAFVIYQEYLGGYATLGHRRGLMVLGERLLRALAGAGERQDEVALPGVLTPAQRFRVACDWGLFRGARGGLAGEIACYQAALKEAADAPLGEVVARRALAYAERQRGRLGAALSACDLALDAAGAAGLAEQRVYCAALRASLLHDLGRVGEAAAGFGDLRSALARRRLAALGGIWQAEQACDLGRHEDCLDLGRGVLSDCEALRDEGLVARCHLMLGRSLVRQDPMSARRHLARAEPWIERTDHTELRLRAQELKSWIDGVREQGRGAFFEAFKGLRLAEDCGYGLLRLRLAVLLVRWAVPCQAPAILTHACRLLTAALEQGCPEYAWGRADALHWLGCAWSRLGDGRARASLEDGLRLRESLGHPDADETRQVLAQACRGVAVL